MVQFSEFSDAFREYVVPIIFDGIEVVFVSSLIQGCFYIMRGDKNTGIDKIKFATLGYLMTNGVYLFKEIIDGIIYKSTLGL